MDQNSQNLSKKELKKLRRLERKNQKSAKSSKIGVLAIILIVLLISYFAAKFYKNPKNQSTKVKDQAVEYSIQSRQHISFGSQHEPYNSNPPTSGPHYSSPASGGIYDKELPDEEIVHNLEHGFVWISYRPDLDQESLKKLQTVAARYKAFMIMTPRSKNDTKIALASWGWLDKFDDFDEPRIVNFIKKHINRGPESLP